MGGCQVPKSDVGGGGSTLPCDLSHDACENITFPQLRFRPVKTVLLNSG